MDTWLIYHGIFDEGDIEDEPPEAISLSILKANSIQHAIDRVLKETYDERYHDIVQFSSDCRKLEDEDIIDVDAVTEGY